jgi:hypothetical protein
MLLAALPAVVQAAATPTKQHAPTDLPSATQMSQDIANQESWTYRKEGLDFRAYKSIMIDPGVVYNGDDAQFGSIPVVDRQQYAGIMSNAMARELGKVLPVVGQSGAGVLRMKITLIGMTTTKGGLATVTRVTPIGFGISTIKSAAGKKGTFSGSMLYALELTDGATGELLLAAVRRSAPDALDIGSTLSTQDTAESIADHVAKECRERLEAAVHGAK